MNSREVLAAGEYSAYQSAWDAFDKKNKPEAARNAHSSKPVICTPFIYPAGERFITRAKVLQTTLRTIDPYFVAKKYGNPFWHMMHYFIALEQMYHASTNACRGNERHVVKDTLEGTKMRAPLFWDDNVSIELVLQPKKPAPNFLFSEDLSFIFYKEDRFPVTEIRMTSYGNLRSYLRDLEQLKTASNGERTPICERLKRKIEMQHVRQHKWCLAPRKKLLVTREELLEQLVRNTPEENAFHDFFSLWDKPNPLL